MAAHRAALRLTPLYLLTAAVTCVALGAAVLLRSTTKVLMIVRFGCWAGVLTVLIFSGVIADNAAESPDDRPDDRQRL
jgi:hypothetical protein